MAFFQNDLYLGMGALFAALPEQHIGALPLEGLVPDRCVDVGANSVPDGSASDAVLHLYPNPTNGQVTFVLPERIASGRIDLFDSVGRLVLSQPLQSVSTVAVDLTPLANGSYTALVHAGSRTMAARILRSW